MFLFRWFGLPVVCLAVGFAGGWRVCGWRSAAAAVTAERRVATVVQREGAATTAAAVKDQAAEDRIRTVTRTITQEVPIYVSPQTDLRFPLPVGFVRLHDAAALGRELPAVPDPAGDPDDAASPVAASDAARVVAANYGDCRADADRLSALQAWIAAEAKAAAS